MMKFNWSNRLFQTQVASIAVVALANFFTFIGTVTPAWQVADDLDSGRYVQSGLWTYCQTGAQCWYIFSDNLINYYEKVDICRFLLIGDCRKKLLRTPYFFGWHYAVLVLCGLSMAAASLAIISAVVGLFKPLKLRITTIFFDILVFISWLLLCIALAVFMVNAAMLESKYLIGIKNTFEKEYGYSFYLAGLGCLLLTFAMMVAVMLTTLVFFTRGGNAAENAYFEAHENDAMEVAQRARMAQQYYTPSKTGTLPRGDLLEIDVRPSSPASSYFPPISSPGAHGRFIESERAEGTFTPTTRHFYSY